MKKNETGTSLHSKWIKYLNVNSETIKILKENIDSKISDIACSNLLLSISPRQGKQKKNKQINLHQTKIFLHRTGNYQQNEKTTHKMGEHIINDASDNGLISKIYF